jgi:hypothetical protein
MTSQQIKKTELQFIGQAANYLENPSFVIKVTNLIGTPIEKGLEALPEKAQSLVATATKKSLEKALNVAIWTINSNNTGSFENGQEKSGWTDWGARPSQPSPERREACLGSRPYRLSCQSPRGSCCVEFPRSLTTTDTILMTSSHLKSNREIPEILTASH